MSVYDVAILGGGLTGCLAAGWISLQKPKWKIALIEPGELGAAFWSGGLKYLRVRPEFTDYLLELGLSFTIRQARGGVWWQGSAVDYPRPGGDSENEAIQKAHYLKTRGTMDGYTSDVMNFGGGGYQYVMDSYKELVRRSVDRANITVYVGKVNSIRDFTHAEFGKFLDVVELAGASTSKIHAPRIVSTIPRPMYIKLLEGVASLPEHNHRWLHSIEVHASAAALGNYDYLYTPGLRNVHRISRTRDFNKFTFEVNSADRGYSGLGRWFEEMDSLMKTNVKAHAVHSIIPGHILPGSDNGWKPPQDHFLIGRYAAWEPRETVDKVFLRLPRVIA